MPGPLRAFFADPAHQALAWAGLGILGIALAAIGLWLYQDSDGGQPARAQAVTPTPTASTTSSVTVTVTGDALLIDGHAAQEDELKALPKDKDIIILAPKDIPYFRVVGMLDLLKSSGHDRVSLATKPIKG